MIGAGVVTTAELRTVQGVLLDSLLTNDVLRGALLALDGVTHVATTSAEGLFVFDSVTPGVHRLLVRHPLLDSLGVDTVSTELRIGSDSGRVTAVLPSPTAFIASRCGAGVRRGGDGMVVGVVRRAESDQPVPDAEVAAAWRGTDSTFAGGGLRERARVRSNALGQYVICRVPRFTAVELWPRLDARDAARVRVQLGSAMIGAFDLSLDSPTASGTATTAAAPTGVISGRVLTVDG
ncbi:MAG TPA: carboxypeptidase-like regulatory domain-containing protein, partial [Gemmatimonadaceae bacterium]|nr:carboxypeptidase-like regulatory domain-containing protein [Gemmatimonadaceae bacterium]